MAKLLVNERVGTRIEDDHEVPLFNATDNRSGACERFAEQVAALEQQLHEIDV